MKYFICKSEDMWLDSWTYGDWRQYVCKRPDGALQCARISTMPASIGTAGALLFFSLVIVLAILLFNVPDKVAWERASIALSISFSMMLPAINMIYSKHRLMVAVGPKQYDGKRLFDHEVETGDE